MPLQNCLQQAQGIIIPTSFAPINPKAVEVSTGALEFGGQADLHSAAGWEILYIVRQVIGDPANGILARPDTVAADRAALRTALANLSSTLDPSHARVSEDGALWDIASGDTGILGPANRTASGESSKPFIFVQLQVGSDQAPKEAPRMTCAQPTPPAETCGMFVCTGPLVERCLPAAREAAALRHA